MTKTEWYPGHVDPVHEGVYQKLNTSSGMLFFSRWNGACWMTGHFFRDGADMAETVSVKQDAWPWRGLTSEAA